MKVRDKFLFWEELGRLEMSVDVCQYKLSVESFYSGKQTWIRLLMSLTWKFNLILLTVTVMLRLKMRCFMVTSD